MFNISKKNIIITACIGSVVIASCGYSIISKKMSGQVTITANTQETTSKVTEPKQKEKGNESKEIVVHIIGQVKNPGIVKIPDGARISDAIKAAGGVLPEADLEVVNLAYKLQDGKQIYIPSKKENRGLNSETESLRSFKPAEQQLVNKVYKPVPGVQPDVAPPSKAPTVSAGVINSNQEQQRNDKMVNINTADEKALDTLPGIGPSTAKKIIEYRKTNGDFSKPADIMNVKGIGQSKYDNIKNSIIT